MRYERQQDSVLITFEKKDDVKEWLLAIATQAYETALPRGLGHKEGDLHPAEKWPNLEGYIENGALGPKVLVMDYINGRDCRTMIAKREDGTWYFNAYAFEQRKVTAEEFGMGKRVENVGKFLDEVIHIMGVRT